MPPHETERWRDFLGPGALSTLGFATLIELLGLGVPLLVRLRQVLGVSRRDDRGPADAILVVGRALRADRPTPGFAARLAHGAELFRAGLAPRVIVAGGLTGRATRTEAAAGREVLLELGVPADAILCEDRSRHTLENLAYVRATLRQHDWPALLVVSDPLHLARIAALARGLGLDARCSPATAATPRGWRYWWRALREAHLLHWYHVGVGYSRLVRNQRYLARVT
jgi:uncharacterized SAM-binding protein YcdF (DUF218 family)